MTESLKSDRIREEIPRKSSTLHSTRRLETDISATTGVNLDEKFEEWGGQYTLPFSVVRSQKVGRDLEPRSLIEVTEVYARGLASWCIVRMGKIRTLLSKDG